MVCHPTALHWCHWQRSRTITRKPLGTIQALLGLHETLSTIVDTNLIIGIVRPYQTNSYRAFLSISHQKKIPSTLEQTKIKPRKYAAFFVKAGQMNTISTAHQFLQQWQPANNYKIGDSLSFQFFSVAPSLPPKTNQKRVI